MVFEGIVKAPESFTRTKGLLRQAKKVAPHGDCPLIGLVGITVTKENDASHRGLNPVDAKLLKTVRGGTDIDD